MFLRLFFILALFPILSFSQISKDSSFIKARYYENLFELKLQECLSIQDSAKIARNNDLIRYNFLTINLDSSVELAELYKDLAIVEAYIVKKKYDVEIPIILPYIFSGQTTLKNVQDILNSFFNSEEIYDLEFVNDFLNIYFDEK